MPMKKVAEKYNEVLIKIGLNVLHYRKLRCLTQEQLAEKTDESTSTISNIENSNKYHSMALGTLLKIAGALDIPIKNLFEFKNEDD